MILQLKVLLIFILKSNILHLTLAKPQGAPSGFPSCNVIEEKSGTVKPCILPFKMNDQIFDSCTNYSDEENKYWCSTNVNDNGFHIGNGMGFWGHCPDECISTTTTTTTTATTTATKTSTSVKPRPIFRATDELKKALENIVGGINVTSFSSTLYCSNSKH